MLLGAYGANVVHMSMLHEYVANKIGAKIGPYTQVSDSFHVYLDGYGAEVWNRVMKADPLCRDLYTMQGVTPMPMEAKTPAWDTDLATFFECFDNEKVPYDTAFMTRWFKYCVCPMWRAFYFRDVEELETCLADDWKLAGREWLDRRDQ